MTKSGNPYHEPAGTSKGGQFARKPGGAEDAARGAAGLETRAESRAQAVADFVATTKAKALSEGYEELEWEMGWLVGPNGEIRLQLDGDESSISMDDKDLNLLEGNYFIHNHPQGGAFSVQDVEMGIKHNTAGLIVTNSKREHYLEFSFPEKWSGAFREELAEDVGKFYHKSMNWFRNSNAIKATGDNFSDGMAIWVNSGIHGLTELANNSPWADYIDYSYKE